MPDMMFLALHIGALTLESSADIDEFLAELERRDAGSWQHAEDEVKILLGDAVTPVFVGYTVLFLDGKAFAVLSPTELTHIQNHWDAT